MPQTRSVLEKRTRHNNTTITENNALGLTADGRKRWKKPKKLTTEELFLLDFEAKQLLNMEIAANLSLNGLNWDEIATKLLVPVEKIIDWPKSAKYQEIYDKALNLYRKQQKALLLSLVPRALSTMDSLMSSARSEHVRYEAAQAILTHAEIAKDSEEEETIADHSTFLESLRKKAEKVVHNTTDSHSLVAVQVNVGSFPAPEKGNTIINGEYKEISQ
jgi:hypothetical protein